MLSAGSCPVKQITFFDRVTWPPCFQPDVSATLPNAHSFIRHDLRSTMRKTSSTRTAFGETVGALLAINDIGVNYFVAAVFSFGFVWATCDMVATR